MKLERIVGSHQDHQEVALLSGRDQNKAGCYEEVHPYGADYVSTPSQILDVLGCCIRCLAVSYHHWKYSFVLCLVSVGSQNIVESVPYRQE